MRGPARAGPLFTSPSAARAPLRPEGGVGCGSIAAHATTGTVTCVANADTAAQWAGRLDHFDAHTGADNPSSYLRQHGIYTTIADLAGDVDDLAVLDAGCGPGWVHQLLTAGTAYQCDIVDPPERPGVHSSRQRLDALTYPDEAFDLIVNSLVLIYVDDIDAVYRELARVTRPGGRLIVALPHPYFYRTGHVTADGSVAVTRDLEHEWRIDDLYIGGTVGPFTYYGRRPDTYVNAALAAGWQLLETRDWFIDIDDYRRRFPDDTTRSRHVPLYQFLHLVRPGA